MLLTILGWIVFGLIAGVIAKLIMPGKDPGGIIVTILIGIAGAIIGGLIAKYLLGYGSDSASTSNLTEPGFLMSLLLAVIGAIILLGLYRLIKGRTA